MARQSVGRDATEARSREHGHAGCLGRGVRRQDALRYVDLVGEVDVVGAGVEARVEERGRGASEGRGGEEHEAAVGGEAREVRAVLQGDGAPRQSQPLSQGAQRRGGAPGEQRTVTASDRGLRDEGARGAPCPVEDPVHRVILQSE